MKTVEIACSLLAILSAACGDAGLAGKIASDAGAEVSAYEPETGAETGFRWPEGLQDASADSPPPADAAACCTVCVASWAACCGNCTDTCLELVDAGIEPLAKCLSDCATIDQAACTPSYAPCFAECGGCGSPNLAACPP